MSTNAERSSRAGIILDRYDEDYMDGDCAKDLAEEMRTDGEPAHDGGWNPYAVAVSDLLADIMHWCDEAGVDFADRTRVAQENHDAEREEEACEQCGGTADSDSYDNLCDGCGVIVDEHEGGDHESGTRIDCAKCRGFA